MNRQKMIVVLAGLLVLIAAAAAALVLARPGAAEAVRAPISPAQYDALFSAAAPHVLIDVRTAEEFASGHIDGAINIPVESLGERLGEVPRDVPVVLYCRSGRRSAAAAELLAQASYAQVYDLGGIQTWEAQGRPVVR